MKKKKKRMEDLNRHLSKEDTQIVKSLMKRCSASLTIRQTEISTPSPKALMFSTLAVADIVHKSRGIFIRDTIPLNYTCMNHGNSANLF